MAKLIMRTKIFCNTCGCALQRRKTIMVNAVTEAEAKTESKAKIKAWKETLKGQNCKICKSIIKDAPVETIPPTEETLTKATPIEKQVETLTEAGYVVTDTIPTTEVSAVILDNDYLLQYSPYLEEDKWILGQWSGDNDKLQMKGAYRTMGDVRSALQELDKPTPLEDATKKLTDAGYEVKEVLEVALCEHAVIELVNGYSIDHARVLGKDKWVLSQWDNAEVRVTLKENCSSIDDIIIEIKRQETPSAPVKNEPTPTDLKVFCELMENRAEVLYNKCGNSWDKTKVNNTIAYIDKAYNCVKESSFLSAYTHFTTAGKWITPIDDVLGADCLTAAEICQDQANVYMEEPISLTPETTPQDEVQFEIKIVGMLGIRLPNTYRVLVNGEPAGQYEKKRQALERVLELTLKELKGALI